MKSRILKALFVVFLVCLKWNSPAQQIDAFTSVNKIYKDAIELFLAEKYGSAQTLFQKIYESIDSKDDELKSSSYFYMGYCAVNLFHANAEFLLKDFIENYPVNAHVTDAKFLLARVHFQNKQYKKALPLYNDLDTRFLSPENMDEYKFGKAYSAFFAGDYNPAKVLFNELKNTNNKYRTRAMYYSGHIAYEEENYEAALRDFKPLLGEKAYNDAVPFYLTQIYFLQKKYEELIAIAPDLIAKASEKRVNEILRSVALAYYNLQRYTQAEEYFDKFLKINKTALPDEDNYAIGYTYYQNKKYDKAVEFLSLVTSVDNPLAQSALYTIGDAQVHLKNYAAAAQSFYLASQLGFDEVIKEDALYNYAKLQYETGYLPFNLAIKAFEDYLNLYPNTKRAEEINSYLATIYLSTKNYAAAFNSLEKITSKSPKLLRAYQKVAYFRALELINGRNYKDAGYFLAQSLKYPFDKEIAFSCSFWKAECLFRENDLKNAHTAYTQYLRDANTKSEHYYDASYGMGYTSLKMNRYKEAVEHFLKVVKAPKNSLSENVYQDALLRTADCYYMLLNESKALEYYAAAIKNSPEEADYAAYQQAIIYGLQGNYNKKCDILRTLTRSANSSYAVKAQYELASTLYAMDKYSEAIELFNSFTQKYPKNTLTKNAYLKLAQAYLNTNQEAQAVRIYKLVFENYPGSPEAQDALASLESIYTENGSTSDFFTYLQGRSNVNVSQGKQDSTVFKAGEIKYFRGECPAAVKAFEEYLSKFPTGAFAAMAHFYRAECNYGAKAYDKALLDYEAIISKYNTDFNETAYRKAAEILLVKKDYATAFTYYNRLLEITDDENTILTAHNGKMRAAFNLNRYSDAIAAADKIYNHSRTDMYLKEEALAIMAQSHYRERNNVEAKKYFAQLAQSGTGDLCAEAAYMLAEIEFKEGNLAACEKRITEMIAGSYSSEYWLAKTYMLYGDIYMQRGNYLQAKTTYKSIIEGYTGTDLSRILEEKYNQAVQAEEGAKNKK